MISDETLLNLDGRFVKIRTRNRRNGSMYRRLKGITINLENANTFISIIVHWWVYLFSLFTERLLWILATCLNVGAMDFSSNTSIPTSDLWFVEVMLFRWQCSHMLFWPCRSTLHRVLGNGQERYSVRLLLIFMVMFLAIYSVLACNVLNSSKTWSSKMVYI